ncbi:hypothetical protein EZS27_002938 [termite gut metagenome]|uniref:Glycosyl transferase family 1 domain-containing protein n=1 Tax=termite gut metagenome TaxID=433724 RepID=A0A5J4SWL5_9ZZZZ
MRIILLDTFSYKCHHEKYNAGLLSSIIKIGYETVYICSRSSRNRVYPYLREEDTSIIHYKNTFVVHGKKGWLLYLRFILSAFMNIIFLMKSNKNDILFFNSNPYILFFIFNWLNKYVFNRKVIICCHGELELLINTSHSLYLGKYVRDLFLNQSLKLAKNIRFAVLDHSIRDNLSEILPPNIISHLVSFNHPYIFDEINNACVNKFVFKDQFVLGTISNLTEERGMGLLHVAKKLLPNEKILIKSIGRVLSEKTANRLKKQGVILSGYLPRDEYEKQIQSLDYILYFYPCNSYKYTASGALFDAINYQKPIIAIENYYFRNVFKEYASIGYLVHNEDEIVDLIKILLSSHGNLAFDNSFKFLKSQFSPSNITTQISNIILNL